MRTPAWDASFPESKIHGAEAQLATLRQVVRHCPQSRVAIDVGAHIGTWTLGLAQKFERVYAFEPQAENFACLVANVGDVAVLENVALGAQNATCQMVLPEKANSGMWRAAPGTEVLVRPLDAYGLTDVDFIKLDCEGYEGEALLGALSTLRRCQPTVWFEDNGLGLAHYGAKWVDPKALLTGLGYAHVLRIRKDELWVHQGERI